MKLKHFLLFIVIAWLPFIMAAWDKDKPAATTALNTSNGQILDNFSALETSIGQDHEFSTGGPNSGKHLQVTYDDPIAFPSTVAASEGILFTFDVDSVAELWWINENEGSVQLTSGTSINGYKLASSSVRLGAMAANSIDSDQYVDGSIDSAHFEGTLPDGADLASKTEPGDADLTIATKGYVDSYGVRQVVYTRDTTTLNSTTLIPFDDTIPQSYEGSELFTLSITPVSTTSTLIIQGNVLLSSNAANRFVILALFQDSTGDALATFCQELAVANTLSSVPFYYAMPAGTAVSTTFKLRAGLHAAGTTYYNSMSTAANIFGGKEGSTMIITEIGS